MHPHTQKAAGAKGRLLSLDAYRGYVVLSMVLVNCPGDEYQKYAPFYHAVWNGWTFTDLIAPAFLWIIGVSMVFALQRRMEASADRGKLLGHIVRRSAVIYLIGMGLALVETYDWSTVWSDLKVLGILQRIAVSYLLAATLFVVGRVRGQALWVAVGSLLYVFLSFRVPVPGGRPFDPMTNVAGYLDYLLLGRHGGNPHTLLSLLTSTATISLGALVGSLLKLEVPNGRKIIWLLSFGAGLLFLGEVAGLWIPVNRRLWTPSFVFLMTGISTITFAAFFWVIEVLGFRKWTTALVGFGMNAILIFSLSELGRIVASKKGVTLNDGHWISVWDQFYRILLVVISNPENTSLLFSVLYVSLFASFSYLLYRKGWVVKV